MSYKCIIGHKVECDGCGDCKKIYLSGLPKQSLTCDCCGCNFYEGEYYYDVNNELLCKDCLDEKYGIIYVEGD